MGRAAHGHRRGRGQGGFGHFAASFALDPGFFHPEGGREPFAAVTSALAGIVKDTPPAPGFDEVLLPGEPELRSRAERARAGIALPATTWPKLAGRWPRRQRASACRCPT